jgi:hypothetical protein
LARTQRADIHAASAGKANRSHRLLAAVPMGVHHIGFHGERRFIQRRTGVSPATGPGDPADMNPAFRALLGHDAGHVAPTVHDRHRTFVEAVQRPADSSLGG